ncbi:MAG: porin [Bacteroidota bacterium]
MLASFHRFRSLLWGCFLLPALLVGQGSPDYQGGLKMKLNADGSKYVRLLSWHQVWATAQPNAEGKWETDFLLRRSRMLMYAQINDRFLINTHFGVNSLGPANMGTASPTASPGGNGQFFLHDAWGQYAVVKGKLDLGTGLHYWNGISRLTNQSTLNLLTLDAPLHNWATIGTSDQFARHLGFFAKGKLGKLDYRLSVNEALDQATRGPISHVEMDENGKEVLIHNRAVYHNPDRPGGGKVFQGYLNYQFLDQEGNLLPYFVGSYLGTKRVFNVGAGFFHHVEGASSCDEAGNVYLHSPTSLAVDVFYDAPMGENGAAWTAYGSLTHHDWGPNWTGGVGGVGTGQIAFGQVGYLLPTFSESGRLQVYSHLTQRHLQAYETYESPLSHSLGLGLNWYLDGHHAKISLEYQRNWQAAEQGPIPINQLMRLQTMVYL